MPQNNKTVMAVIVSYNADPERICVLIDSALAQTHDVVIVDNGSHLTLLTFLRDLARLKNFRLIEFESNQGIAAAHNAGIRCALDQGRSYVLLLDHDSLLMPDCVEQLLRVHQKMCCAGVRVAAVGPRFLDQTTGGQAPFLQFNRWSFSKIYCTADDDAVEVSVLISSGSLISVDVLNEIGYMDETLFIDGVDWEWCFRATARGFHLFGVAAASMLHSLGDSSIQLLFWKIPLHSPSRHYYAYRNTVLLCRRKFVPFSWKLHFSIRLLVRFGIYMVFAPNRIERCRNIFKGLQHGWSGRSGRI